MRVMISQPRYLPSVSYLERIAKADIFIVFDTVQRVQRGYENRNKIKNKANGQEKWLTIPIKSDNRCLIKDTVIDGMEWQDIHRNAVSQYYRCKNIDHYYSTYLANMQTLAYSNALTDGLKYLLTLFHIKTEVVLASQLTDIPNGGKEQLINLTKKVGGTSYLSGPTCLDYGLTHSFVQEYGLQLEIDENKNYVNWLEMINVLLNKNYTIKNG
jgi:hypothetical protein